MNRPPLLHRGGFLLYNDLGLNKRMTVVLTDEFIEWLKSYAERGYDDNDALASFRLAQTAFAQATLEKLGVSYEIEGRKW